MVIISNVLGVLVERHGVLSTNIRLTRVSVFVCLSVSVCIRVGLC